MLIQTAVFGKGTNADRCRNDDWNERNQPAALGHNQDAHTDQDGHERERRKCFEKNHTPFIYRFTDSAQAEFRQASSIFHGTTRHSFLKILHAGFGHTRAKQVNFSQAFDLTQYDQTRIGHLSLRKSKCPEIW